MRITITGASGFVGQNLQRYLTKDIEYEVETLSMRDKDWSDYLNYNSNAIIHLAGKAHDTSNTSVEEEYFKVNRDLTIKLFDLFIQSNISDFFFFSSVKAVADTVQGELTEEENPKPLTAYGRSKLQAEEYILNTIIPEGKRVFIIRPCMIHGEGNKGNLNLLYKVVKLGVPWPLASFQNNRSFVGIENLSYLVINMLNNKEVSSGIYNFSDDNPLSTNDLIKIMAKLLGRRPYFWYISTRIINSIAKIGDILPLPLNSERLKKLTESYVVSNSKIKRALKIKSLPITTEKGLETTINSFKNAI